MELETKGAVIFMKKKIIVLLTIAILSLCNTSVFAGSRVLLLYFIDRTEYIKTC